MSTQPDHVDVDEAFAQLQAMSADQVKGALARLAGYDPALFVKVIQFTSTCGDSPRASLTSGR